LKEKKEEEEILAELAKKYRDRAKERRDGGETTGPDSLSTLGAYRAVAPDIKTYICSIFFNTRVTFFKNWILLKTHYLLSRTMDAAERRKKMIQESKFLGGDMEHTVI